MTDEKADGGHDALAEFGIGKGKPTAPSENGKRVRKNRPRVTSHYPLVEIIWDDAAGLRHGWLDKADKMEPQLVHSVGWLISDTDAHIMFASDTDSDGAHNGRTQIPRGMVRYMRVLRKAMVKKNGV